MTYNNYKNLKDSKFLVIGANGGIGSGIVSNLKDFCAPENIIEISRSKMHSKQLQMDMLDEQSIESCSNSVKDQIGSIDIIVNATGLLHTKKHKPERTYGEISINYLREIFEINTFSPFLIAKYFTPLLSKDSKSIIAFLSARLGSISDNNLGGWYSYRSSKSALNMLIKTLSLELSYKNKKAICIGLHPGTVDTNLSSPFTPKLQKKNLFTKEHSAQLLLQILNNVDYQSHGCIIDWQGKIIPS
tara:strand:- start:8961 stop:9695 length:735 start_codon:yes stop_codon:yes gene_type:complete